MGEEKLHQVALCLIPGLGSVSIRQLITYCGSARKVFSSNARQLSCIPGIGDKTAATILGSPALADAETELARAAAKNIQLIFYGEPSYPGRLKRLKDAPLLLYVKGKMPLNHPRTIGIVGTRRPSSYGREVIEQIIPQLRPFAPVIISGMAYGIDIAAHRCALAQGLPTIGVMGNSLDAIYPPEHKGTARKMLQQGGVISELKLGTKPEAFQFPRRNRIIAALSDALLVIEAREKGGALITADIARSYQRPVFAIPGNIHQDTSQGCNQLIKAGRSRLATGARDMARYLGWSQATQPLPLPTAAAALSASEHEIVALLSDQPSGMLIDDLCWQTQIPINKMGAILLDMEFAGIIRCLPGKKFSLNNK